MGRRCDDFETTQARCELPAAERDLGKHTRSNETGLERKTLTAHFQPTLTSFSQPDRGDDFGIPALSRFDGQAQAMISIEPSHATTRVIGETSPEAKRDALLHR